MTLLEGMDYVRSVLGAQEQRSRHMARLDRARLVGRPQQNYTFGEQLGAAFRTENLFFTHALPFLREDPAFPEDPEFEASRHLGEYEQYVNQYPELLQAGSRGELAFWMDRVDAELRDRRRLENMGFGRSLAVFLPAGLLSPENFIPIGTAARAGSLTAKAAKAAGTSRILGAAFRTGTEAVITQTLAEMALAQKQRFRTEEEALYNVVGAGLFGTLFGGFGGAIGEARRSATKALLGAESVTDAVEQGNDAIARAMGRKDSKLGTLLDAEYDRMGRSLTREGGSDVLPKTVGEEFYGDSLSLDVEKGLQKALADELRESNPKLARMVGADSRVGKLLTNLMFMNPAQRTARSKFDSVRTISDLMLGTFLTEGPKRGPALESRIDLNEAILLRKATLASQSWQVNAKKFKGVDVSESEFLDMAGQAARRGGVTDHPRFEKIRDNAELQEVVNERARQHQEIKEILYRTADETGALSRSEIESSGPEQILDMLDGEHVNRVMDQDKVRENSGKLVDDIQAGLRDRAKRVLPEFVEERAALAALIDAGVENPAYEKVLLDQLKEYDDWITKLQDDGVYRNTALSIADNYTSRGGSTAGQAPFQSSLAKRVLKIDETFLEDFLVSNVEELEARLLRSVMPDLTMSDFWSVHGGNRDMNAAVKERLDQLTKTVNTVTETGRATPELAEKIVRDMQDLSDDAQGLALLETLRLARELEPLGVESIAKTRRQIESTLRRRSKHRRRMQDIDLERRDLSAQIKEMQEEGLHELYEEEFQAMKQRRTTLGKERALLREEFDAATAPINELAEGLMRQLRDNSSSSAQRAGDLRLSDNMFKVRGAEELEDSTAQLLALARTTHGRVSGLRRYVHDLNVDKEHLEVMVRREWNRQRDGEFKPGMRTTTEKRLERDLRDLGVIHDRLRNRHGVGASTDAWTVTSKRIRDFNYVTKMGSVVLSSFPDVAMAISTAGFKDYAAATAKFLTTQLFGGEKVKRSYAMELQRAVERFSIFKRHDKLMGVGSDAMLMGRSRMGRAADAVIDKFSKATLIEQWNTMNKMVAAQAIESRVSRTLLEAAGKDLNARDLALFEWFGLSKGDMNQISKQLAEHSTNEGGLRLANVEDWSNRNARLKWQAAMFKAVNSTIITPSAGALPNFVTAHPTWKMIMQFRTFSFAATNQFLIPGLQRSLALGDMGPPITFAMLSMLGIFVHGLNELLKGRDPSQQSALELAGQGVDRGGGLGILTEATSSGLRLLNGLGVEGAGKGSSRFASRNEVDAILGPSLGAVKDVLSSLTAWTQDDFSKGDASQIRRVIPFQNLWLVRILLDGGANLASNGTKRYFDDFLKIEHRLSGFTPEEVNK